MRIRSVDVLRGLACVLMAIDHVRVFSGVPAGSGEPAVFFTRWVTHYCAPAFVFFAGTSAFLYARTHADVSRFLVTRGLWLVLLELTVVRLAWTFNLGWDRYLLAGVLWAIGWSMVLLAALVKGPRFLVAAFGLAVVAGHHLLPAFDGPVPWWGKILYVGFFDGPIGPLVVLYSLVPWVGVMALGWTFGAILVDERRDRWCLALGLGATLLFILLRATDLYGEPRPWAASDKPPWLAFLDTSKYPASFLFLLMTLGPTILAVPLVERVRGPISDWLAGFGRVPFFFYLLHLPLLHLLALAAGGFDPWLFADHPMGAPRPPDGFRWGLPLLYLVWGIAMVVLTIACRWFAALKRRRDDWWLRYL